MPDHRHCYEKVRQAVDLLSGDGPLSARLEDAVGILTPLRIEDYPTEELKRLFTEVTWTLAKEEAPLTLEAQRRIAAKIIDLFAGVCRLQAMS